MNKFLSSSQLFLKRNSATILTCIGGIGVVATSVMAVKATPRALRRIKNAEKEKGKKLTKVETVVAAAPSYIPATVTGAATIACIFGANALNKRTQAALMSAYALLDSSFKDYRKKAVELYGEDADDEIRAAIAKGKFTNVDISATGDKVLFYDFYSDRFFESTVEAVQNAEYQLNRNLMLRDYAYLNEFYELLGLEPIEAGYKLGWSTGMCMDYYWQPWIDFSHDKAIMDDGPNEGLECYIIAIEHEPILDFENYC